MGYIKKLKNNELVGGTDKTTIYPVTSSEAVFEETTNGSESSFKSQKTINKEQQDKLDDHEERIQAAEAEDIKSITINGSTKKFEVDSTNNVDLTIYTVDSDPDMPSIADNVRDLRDVVGTSEEVLPGSHKTRIETLEGGESVTGSVENKIKTKVDSINSSYQDDNNEYVKYSMTQTSGKVTDFNIDETSLKNAITSLNTSISGDNIVIRQGSTPSGTGKAGKIYRYVNSSNNTYTDYMYSGGSWVPLATHDTSNEQAQVAYYTCAATGSGAQATKQFVSNGSLEYTPSSGGHIKILMGEANTATGTIYLKFGTTSATDSTKKPLYYNGEPASASNTWEAGETIAVYYDPSANNNTGAYFASNAQGGGGKAEKIKYDNSQSGLDAENVQEAVDAVFEDVQLQNIEEYSSTLSVPSNAQFRIIVPFNFVVGETYNIEVSTENAVSQSVRFYVYRTGEYSNNTNKLLGEIPAGGTTAKTTYTPVSETNYQFFGFWNNNNAATSVDVTITKKQKAINNIVSDTQDVAEPLQLEEFFNDHLPDLKVLDYDIYDIKNLNIHGCVVDASNKWYASNASYGQNAKHIAVPVIDGSIVIMRGNYNVMQFWLNASYNPNTTYSSGSSAPIVGSRHFIEGTDAVLYTPTNAAYFAVSVVDGTYLRSVDPIIIVVKNYINKAVSIPHITTDFEVGCTNESVLKVVKSEDNIYTFVCYNSVQYNYAYIKIPVVVGHKYKLCFNAAARAKLNSEWNGLMVLKKTNPEERINDGNYKSVTLGKTNQEYFEWNFTAEYPIAYMRTKATDLGNPNFGNATIVVKNIKLIDMGTTDMDAATPILMDGEMSAINSVLDNAAIIDIVDDGLYVCDRYLNVGGYLDINGIHANNLNS